jgi:phage tail tape-measure protein
MLSKGKVTTEELRRQLGERLPGAFGIMAASLGVTLPKLDEMLKKGELLSAEVLPGFARAVELAFGLDTVKKVDTLVASQNRLTTAWQNFVKNLTGEGSIIKGFFKTLYGAAEEFVKGIDELFNSGEVGNAKSMSKGFEEQTKLIKKDALKQLEDTKKDGEKLKDLQLKVQKALGDAKGKLADDIAHTRVQQATKALLDFAKETDAIEEKIAIDTIRLTLILHYKKNL